MTAAQGTHEWRMERCGKVTASRFADVMTQPKTQPKTQPRMFMKFGMIDAEGDGKILSKTAESYMMQVIGERLTGIPVEVPDNAAMAWGRDNEDKAIRIYELTNGLEVTRRGFETYSKIKNVGCSVDGLTEGGAIEVKCPWTTREHVRNLISREVPKQYKWQVIAPQLILNCAWTDFVSYDPRIEVLDKALVIVRVERDEALIQQLHDGLERFCGKLETILEGLNR